MEYYEFNYNINTLQHIGTKSRGPNPNQHIGTKPLSNYNLSRSIIFILVCPTSRSILCTTAWILHANEWLLWIPSTSSGLSWSATRFILTSSIMLDRTRRAKRPTQRRLFSYSFSHLISFWIIMLPNDAKIHFPLLFIFISSGS